ncbi:MAG: ribosome silencing factor [Spirochaetes bacterium]|nr:ribosome silencing factor [Spirochaetota bacterium]
MKPFDLVKEIVGKLEEKKAENIVVLDLKRLTTLTDYFIIATGTSFPHLKALAREIVNQAKEKHSLVPLNPLPEGDDSWVLVDYQDCIVHLFLEESRQFYNLEELWFESKKVDIKTHG